MADPRYSRRSPVWFGGLEQKPACAYFLSSGMSDENLMRRTVENPKSRNVTIAVTDGDLEAVEMEASE